MIDMTRLIPCAWEHDYLPQIWKCIPDVEAIAVHWGGDMPLPFVNGRTVLVIASDEEARVPPESAARAIVKQYVHPADTSSIPLPLGLRTGFPDLVPKPIASRSLDVSFVGSPWCHRQALIGRLCRNPKLRGLKTQFELSARLSMAEYAALLNDTKISICAAGRINVETYRYFESVRMGCITITPQYPNNCVYVRGPGLVVETPEAIASKIVGLLANATMLDRMHNAALAAWEERYSPKAVAARIKGALLEYPKRRSKAVSGTTRLDRPYRIDRAIRMPARNQ